MPRQTKKKVTKDGRASGGRRKCTPWDSDRINLASASSLDVLMAWLTKPGNVERWRQEKPALACREIMTALKKNGILHRKLSDVRAKIGALERKFDAGTAYLSLKGQTDAFERGKADKQVVAEVLKLCPLYRDLGPVFGRKPASKTTPLMVKDVAHGAARATAVGVDKHHETTLFAPATSDTVGGSKSAPGQWKESVEKDRRRCDIQETIQDGDCGQVVEKTLHRGQTRAVGVEDEKTEGEQNPSSRTGDSAAIAATNAVRETARAAVANEERSAGGAEKNQVKEIASVAMEDKSSGAGGRDEIGEAGLHYVKEVGEGIVVNVEDDDDDDKQSIDDDDEKDAVLEQVKAHANLSGSAVDSSDEEERRQVNTYPEVSRILKTKLQSSDSEESSSEEEESEEETRMKKEEQDDDDDGEQIQLAQPDDVAERSEDEEEIAEVIEVDEDEEIAELIEVDEEKEETAEKELIEVDEEDDTEVEADEKDENEVKEVEEIEEEEAEEEPELGGGKAGKPESSSSESESEGNDNEEEVPPTQLKAASDCEEESDHDSQHDEDDADMAEDASESVNQRQPSRKRSSLGASFSRSTKRVRDNRHTTSDLEREAFLERVKQERAQRDELFQLERAKVTCELQAKQVQLAMERSLARKKLVSAGIDPIEVDRILPL